MRINYHQETDSLYIHLVKRPGIEAREVSPGIIIDFDKEGKPIGIDIEHAQNILDMDSLNIASFPLKKVSSA